jgi:hypothetical protein
MSFGLDLAGELFARQNWQAFYLLCTISCTFLLLIAPLVVCSHRLWRMLAAARSWELTLLESDVVCCWWLDESMVVTIAALFSKFEL